MQLLALRDVSPQDTQPQQKRVHTSLLELPVELVHKIFNNVTRADLLRLASVNSRCYQLNRPHLLASIKFSRWQHSRRIVKCLFAELELDEQGAPCSALEAPKMRTIGNFVHHLTLDCGMIWPLDTENWESEMIARGMSTSLSAVAAGDHMTLYIRRIAHILNNSGKVMPCLASLHLVQLRCVYPDIFRAIRNITTLKSVRLAKCILAHGFVFDALKVENQAVATGGMREAWPLRNLHLEIEHPSRHQPGEIDILLHVMNLSIDIIAACASTLETLTWRDISSGPLAARNIDSIPDFAKLRKLKLGYLEFWDSRVLDRILKNTLTHLELSNVDCPLPQSILISMRKMPYLQVFVIGGRYSNVRTRTALLEFLMHNQQLQKLDIRCPSSGDLHAMLLPMLRTSHKQLVSLGLTAWGYSISWTTIETTSQLKTLKQLSIKGDPNRGTVWVIDHAKLQQQLSSLPNLRKLVLQNETYGDPPSSEALGLYYPDDRSGPDSDSESSFEKLHRVAMLGIAAEYAKCMPRLERIYIGQIPFAIKTSLMRGRLPVPESEKRVKLKTRFDYMFGWENPLDEEDRDG